MSVPPPDYNHARRFLDTPLPYTHKKNTFEPSHSLRPEYPHRFGSIHPERPHAAPFGQAPGHDSHGGQFGNGHAPHDWGAHLPSHDSQFVHGRAPFNHENISHGSPSAFQNAYEAALRTGGSWMPHSGGWFGRGSHAAKTSANFDCPCGMPHCKYAS